jgi:uncharacterized protein (UPF0548 family)
MTTQRRTLVQVKARPKVTGFIYGSLQDRISAGMRYVEVYIPLPDEVGHAKSQYQLDELEEIGTCQ